MMARQHDRQRKHASDPYPPFNEHDAAYQRLPEVESVEEIPTFANDEEEATFWSTHAMSEQLWMQLSPTPEELLPPSRPKHKPTRAAPSG